MLHPSCCNLRQMTNSKHLYITCHLIHHLGHTTCHITTHPCVNLIKNYCWQFGTFGNQTLKCQHKTCNLTTRCNRGYWTQLGIFIACKKKFYHICSIKCIIFCRHTHFDARIHYTQQL